jgi:hypothetical protein
VGPCRNTGADGEDQKGSATRPETTTPPKRLVAARDALREDDHVRLQAETLNPEPAPKPTKAADHRIDDEQHAGPAADRGDGLKVSLGRWIDPARADDRLPEERGDALRSNPGDGRLKVGDGVIADSRLLAEKRAVTLPVALDPGECRAEAVRAVIAGAAADQVHALGRTDVRPVATSELGRCVDAIAAAAAEHDARVRHGRQLRQSLGELAAGAFAKSPEGRVGVQFA